MPPAPREYKIKPLRLEAMQFTGIGDNWAELIDWTGGRIAMHQGETKLRNDQLNNWYRFRVGDYIVKDAVGDFHVVPLASFEATYELIKKKGDEE